MAEFNALSQILDITYEETTKMIRRQVQNKEEQEFALKYFIPLLLRFIKDFGYVFDKDSRLLYMIEGYDIKFFTMDSFSMNVTFNDDPINCETSIIIDPSVILSFESKSYYYLRKIMKQSDMLDFTAKLLMYKVYMGNLITEFLFGIRKSFDPNYQMDIFTTEDKLCLGLEFQTIWSAIVNKSSIIEVGSRKEGNNFRVDLVPHIICDKEGIFIFDIQLVNSKISD